MEKQYNPDKLQESVENYFMKSALPSLEEYIRIPNLSRHFDSKWNENGLLEKAAEHIKQWVLDFGIAGLTSEVIQFQGLSPIIFTEIKGDLDETYFFYGHYDKQPPFQGWLQGLGPTIPVVKDNKLYGRGGADDGYATYGTMIAIKSLQDMGLPIPRCVMITQGDQQSGSVHIETYVVKLKQRIGNPSLFFCLDSGTLDYERFWLTNSLRGVVMGTLRVDVLTEGIHSGDSSGVVPSAFRIIRMLLDRLQNSQTGQVNEAFQVDIPPHRYQQMCQLSQIKGETAIKEFPLIENTQRLKKNVLSSLINRGWKPQMSVVGAGGLPVPENAGSITLPYNQIKISIRIPPTKNHKQAEKSFVKLLTLDPPFNAKVTLRNVSSAPGFNAPTYSPKLEEGIKSASKRFYGKQRLAVSEGMSIPFMNLLKSLWPKGQFIITGLLGPNSNAHGPNQSMDIPYVKKLICCLAHVVATSSSSEK